MAGINQCVDPSIDSNLKNICLESEDESLLSLYAESNPNQEGASAKVPALASSVDISQIASHPKGPEAWRWDPSYFSNYLIADFKLKSQLQVIDSVKTRFEQAAAIYTSGSSPFSLMTSFEIYTYATQLDIWEQAQVSRAYTQEALESFSEPAVLQELLSSVQDKNSRISLDMTTSSVSLGDRSQRKVVWDIELNESVDLGEYIATDFQAYPVFSQRGQVIEFGNLQKVSWTNSASPVATLKLRAQHQSDLLILPNFKEYVYGVDPSLGEIYWDDQGKWILKLKPDYKGEKVKVELYAKSAVNLNTPLQVAGFEQPESLPLTKDDLSLFTRRVFEYVTAKRDRGELSDLQALQLAAEILSYYWKDGYELNPKSHPDLAKHGYATFRNMHAAQSLALAEFQNMLLDLDLGITQINSGNCETGSDEFVPAALLFEFPVRLASGFAGTTGLVYDSTEEYAGEGLVSPGHQWSQFWDAEKRIWIDIETEPVDYYDQAPMIDWEELIGPIDFDTFEYSDFSVIRMIPDYHDPSLRVSWIVRSISDLSAYQKGTEAWRLDPKLKAVGISKKNQDSGYLNSLKIKVNTDSKWIALPHQDFVEFYSPSGPIFYHEASQSYWLYNVFGSLRGTEISVDEYLDFDKAQVKTENHLSLPASTDLKDYPPALQNIIKEAIAWADYAKKVQAKMDALPSDDPRRKEMEDLFQEYERFANLAMQFKIYEFLENYVESASLGDAAAQSFFEDALKQAQEIFPELEVAEIDDSIIHLKLFLILKDLGLDIELLKRFELDGEGSPKFNLGIAWDDEMRLFLSSLNGDLYVPDSSTRKRHNDIDYNLLKDFSEMLVWYDLVFKVLPGQHVATQWRTLSDVKIKKITLAAIDYVDTASSAVQVRTTFHQEEVKQEPLELLTMQDGKISYQGREFQGLGTSQIPNLNDLFPDLQYGEIEELEFIPFELENCEGGKSCRVWLSDELGYFFREDLSQIVADTQGMQYYQLRWRYDPSIGNTNSLILVKKTDGKEIYDLPLRQRSVEQVGASLWINQMIKSGALERPLTPEQKSELLDMAPGVLRNPILFNQMLKLFSNSKDTLESYGNFRGFVVELVQYYVLYGLIQETLDKNSNGYLTRSIINYNKEDCDSLNIDTCLDSMPIDDEERKQALATARYNILNAFSKMLEALKNDAWYVGNNEIPQSFEARFADIKHKVPRQIWPVIDQMLEDIESF